MTQLAPELIDHLDGRIEHELLNDDDIRRPKLPDLAPMRRMHARIDS